MTQARRRARQLARQSPWAVDRGEHSCCCPTPQALGQGGIPSAGIAPGQPPHISACIRGPEGRQRASPEGTCTVSDSRPCRQPRERGAVPAELSPDHRGYRATSGTDSGCQAAPGMQQEHPVWPTRESATGVSRWNTQRGAAREAGRRCGGRCPQPLHSHCRAHRAHVHEPHAGAAGSLSWGTSGSLWGTEPKSPTGHQGMSAGAGNGQSGPRPLAGGSPPRKSGVTGSGLQTVAALPAQNQEKQRPPTSPGAMPRHKGRCPRGGTMGAWCDRLLDLMTGLQVLLSPALEKAVRDLRLMGGTSGPNGAMGVP